MSTGEVELNHSGDRIDFIHLGKKREFAYQKKMPTRGEKYGRS
jgi:hypothetical protein